MEFFQSSEFDKLLLRVALSSIINVTNHGKIDLTIKMPDKVVILEFKLSKYGRALTALEQIKARGYAQKYLNESKPVYLLGICFDRENKNISEVLFEKVALNK